MSRPAILLAILALCVPYLYDRYVAFAPMVANRPGKFQDVYNIKSHEVKFGDRLKNCEDVILDEAMGIAFLSCDFGRDRWNTVMGTFAPEKGLENGRLFIYDYSKPELPESESLSPIAFHNFPNAKDFHPLGLDFDAATSTLYVINHATTGSVIEAFQISVKSATATHVQTFKHPLITAPNSVQVLGDGKFYVTNDHLLRAREWPILSKIETFSGLPGGSVVYIDTKNPETSKSVARVSFANGLAQLNATTIVVASSGKPGLYFYDIQEDYSLKLTRIVRTSTPIDNISVDSDGKVIMAGHPFAPELMVVSKTRAQCDPKSEIEEERKVCENTSPSWVAEWSEEGGLKELYKGRGICCSSTAVRDVRRGVGIVSSLYGKGLMIFKE